MRILTGVAFAVTATFSSFGQGTSPPEGTPPARSSTAEEVISLPAFSVTADPVNQYLSNQAASAARTVGLILDTPMTINVISPALLQDVGPVNMFVISQYFAGVSSGRGSGSNGINDRHTFRGFESFGPTFDNFSCFLFPQATTGLGNNDVAFVEHAELIMGPDSILAPTGTPGGSINMITKSPLFVQGTDISATVGNYDANRYSIDSTGPLGDGKHMAYRVIAAYRDSKTFLPGAILVHSGSAQFTYKFSETARLTFKYFGEEYDAKGTAPLADLDGEEIYTPDTVRGVTLSNTPQPGFRYQGWNGGASWSKMVWRANRAEAELTAALGERINMRLAAQVYYDEHMAWVGYPSGGMVESWDPVTGEEIGVTQLNPAALGEVAVWQHSQTREIQIQNDYAGNFRAGGVSLQPTIGWAYQQGSYPYNINLKHPLPPSNLAVDYYSPPEPAKNDGGWLFSSNIPEVGWNAQAYGFLRAGLLSDRLFLTAGASRTWAHVHDYSFQGINLPDFGQVGLAVPPVDSTFANTGNSLARSVKPRHDSYMAGILGKVLPNVSVYSSFSTNAGVVASIPNWQVGKQYEFGVKSVFFNNQLSVTVDHFQISESNLSLPNPLFNTGQSTDRFLYADLTNHGYEANVAGGITKDLSIIMSYTTMNLRDFVGRRQRNIPDNMATLMLNYRFPNGALKNANVFAGVIHQGNVAGETVTGFTPLGVPQLPGYYVAAFNVINAGAGYQLGRYKFNLNVDNVLDSKFWWQAQSRTSLAPYPGITFRLTMTVHL